MMYKTTNESALGYLGLSLLAFGGFGLELLSLWLAPEDPAHLHHLITSFLWAITGTLLWYRSRRTHGLDPLSGGDRPGGTKLLGAAVCVAMVVGSVTYLWGGFKPLLEYTYLGSATRFLWQYIYYLAETLLIFLTIAFGQRFGDIAFGRPHVPWGGMVLSLTWGLMHIFTQDVATGMVAMAWSLLYGLVYNLCGHNPRYALPAIAAMFII